MAETRYIEEYRDGVLLRKTAYEVGDETLAIEAAMARVEAARLAMDNHPLSRFDADGAEAWVRTTAVDLDTAVAVLATIASYLPLVRERIDAEAGV